MPTSYNNNQVFNAGEQNSSSFHNELEELHHTYLTLSERVDHLITVICNALNRLSSYRSEAMNQKIIIESNDPSINLQQSLNYSNPITFKNFAELENPVLDSEGFFREKDELGINLGIYSRKPVKIIESSDIKKVQEDYKITTNKVNNLENIVEKMMVRLNKQEERTNKQEDKILQLENENRYLKGIIESQADQIKINILLDTEKNKRIDHLENENQILKTINKVLNEKIDEQQKEIEEKEAVHPIELKNWKKPPEFDANITGIPRDLFLGFKHTMLSNSFFPRESKEETLRRYADEGDYKRLKSLLESDPSIINGRGKPDSLVSAVSEWIDNTALILAAKKGHFRCVELLLQHGANPNYLNRLNLTALDYAQVGFFKKASDILREYGAVNGVDLIEKFGLSLD